MTLHRLPLLALAIAGAAVAQVRPQPGPGDPRLQVVPYDPDQVVQLAVAPGYQLSVEFAPDERIENVAIGDTVGWTATPNKRGDHLFVKPAPGAMATNMTVITDAHSYQFELVGGGGGGVQPFSVRFQYPAAPAASPAAAATPVAAGRYHLAGTRALRPQAISDDGEKTSLVFAPGRTLPAIFSVDALGNEAVVNGAMRDDRYVVDGVFNRLIFRIDRTTATASRVPQLKGR